MIAIFIVTLFLSLTGSIFVNLSKTSKEIRYTAYVTETFTKIAEKVDKMTYDEVAEKPVESNNIADLVSVDDITIDDGTSFSYYIAKSDNGVRATQEITVSASYTISGRENSIEIVFKKISLMDLEDPGSGTSPSGGTNYAELTNKFNLPGTIDGYKPIKRVFVGNGNTSVKQYWIDCTVDDPEWYSIEEGYFPTYVTSNTNTSNTRIRVNGQYQYTYTMNSNTVVYLWIPRIAGTQTEYAYAYGATNQKIEPLDSGGYKVGDDLGAYKVGNLAIFENELGFLQAYKPYSRTFTGNTYSQGRYRADFLPQDMITLIQSMRIIK